MRDLASVFRALADETRLKMLAALFAHDELCVCDFSAALGISQSKASRHLQYLKHAGLLTDCRAGLWAFYRVASDLDAERKALLGAVRRLLAARDLSELEEQVMRTVARRGETLPACRPPARRGRKIARGLREDRPLPVAGRVLSSRR
jgi:ArsR family transcriptional regulator